MTDASSSGPPSPTSTWMQPDVPVREGAVEPKVRKPVHQSDRPPGVLGERGSVGLDIERNASGRAGKEYLVHQPRRLVVVLHAGAEEQRAAGEPTVGPAPGLVEQATGSLVDPEGRGDQAELSTAPRISALDTLVAVSTGGLEHRLFVPLGPAAP